MPSRDSRASFGFFYALVLQAGKTIRTGRLPCKDSESREPCKRSLLGFAWPRRILSSAAAKDSESREPCKRSLLGFASVLHGRDASCLRRQPKVAKVESNANFEGGVLKDSESRARRRTGPESLVPARGSPGRVGWRSVEKYEAAWGQRRKARKKALFLQLPFS